MKIARSLSGYLGAIGLVAMASLVCEAVRSSLAPTNMVMVYLLAVVLAAVRLGLRPAIMTAFLSVLAFDVLFIPPRFSLRVSDTEYLVTFFALFVVGVVISSLVARVHEKIEQVRLQEARTSSLYSLTRDLSVSADMPAIVEALRRAVLQNLNSRLTVILNREGFLDEVPNASVIQLDKENREIAHWVMRSGRRAGAGTAAFPESPFMFVPIKSGVELIGVMVIEESASLPDNLQLIEAFAGQAAMAMERVHLSIQAEEARFLREKSRLEQALLNSISHDLRTPLVTISGVLDSMLNDDQKFDPTKQRNMISTAAEEAARLNRFVGSLLDMTRLEAGALPPRLAPCDVEEIIGCAVGAVESRLGGHSISTAVGPGLPLVAVDLALLTQALVNLLENALKHSPAKAAIDISASFDGTAVIIAVGDNGPGVPSGEEDRIFDKFHRIEVPERTGGSGLGLSIAKGIVEAHRGSIAAANRPEGGLLVEVKLPPVTMDAAGERSNEQ
jgi:two-component system sensor histidine kinase KdpD